MVMRRLRFGGLRLVSRHFIKHTQCFIEGFRNRFTGLFGLESALRAEVAPDYQF